jgi:hypothetical protein
VARAWAASTVTSWFETVASTTDALGYWLERALPLDALAQRPKHLVGLTAASVRQASALYLDVNRMRVVVVGDWAALRGPLSALECGPIQVSDTTGAPVQGR